jgi:sulfide:quinone oxidoreductase
MTRALILGGGFAGVEAAIQLRQKGVQVTLVSEREYIFIYPTSIWLTTGEVGFDDVSIALDKLAAIHKFELIIDSVKEIRSLENKVILKEKGIMEFEYLVVALGAEKVKIPGIENTLSVCADVEQHLKIKETLDALIKTGKGRIAIGFSGNPKDPSALRGGPSFEVMFNIRHLLKKRNVLNNFELTFFAPAEKPGSKMGPNAFKVMDKMFAKLNIHKRLGKKIKGFSADAVMFEDDSRLESDLIIFTAGIKGHSVIEASDLPLTDAGFVKINDYCEALYDPAAKQEKHNVFVIGDSASLDGPEWRAKQGHIAEAMAKVTAFNITEMEKKSTHREGYIHHLNILCVMDTGDGAAIVFRNDKKNFFLPLPWIGHLMKKGWGWYYKASKQNKFPRLPGM